MKTLCTQEKLLEAIQIAERLVGKKESLPVLSCIILEARKNTLSIRATNLETGIDIVIPTEVREEGIVAVPVSIFSQTIRALRGEKVELTVDGDKNLTIQSTHSTTTIKTISPEEFPSIPKSEGSMAHTIPTKVLVDVVQSVVYAASQSMIRPELASILITYQDNVLTAVATDSFRLAEKKIPVRLNEGLPETLVPVKNALELLHVLGGIQEEHVECMFDEAQLTVRAGNIYFVSRIIDATFPQYQAIIPKSFVTEATILKEEMNTVVKKARVFSHTAQEIGLHIYPKKKQFSTTARTADIGETSDSVDAALSGDDLDIKFNIHYLSECFSSIHTDSITMQFGGVGKPLVIRGVGDPTFLYLVMPLNR